MVKDTFLLCTLTWYVHLWPSWCWARSRHCVEAIVERAGSVLLKNNESEIKVMLFLIEMGVYWLWRMQDEAVASFNTFEGAKEKYRKRELWKCIDEKKQRKCLFIIIMKNGVRKGEFLWFYCLRLDESGEEE